MANAQLGASPSGITIINTLAFTTLYDETLDNTDFSLQASYSSSTASTLQVTKASFWAMYFK